jgi:hypothetical protein
MYDDGDDDGHSRPAIPREIIVRKRVPVDAGSTCRPTRNKSPSAGSGTACTCTGSSRSSNSTGARLRSFFVRKASKLLGGRRLSNKISKRPKEAHAADEGHAHEVDVGGHNADGRPRSAACDENEVRAVAQGAPADTAQMPPPSFEEALRLGLLKIPSQQESLQQNDCA